MALSTRSSGSVLQRKELVEKTSEKLMTAIDEASKQFNKRSHRRESKSSTIPVTHRYKLANEDTCLIWGEEEVANITNLLNSWPDRNLHSCCEGLDNRHFSVTVVQSANQYNAEASTSARAEIDSNSGRPAEKDSEAMYIAHESIRQRLLQLIKSKIGRPIVLSPNNQRTNGETVINLLKNDPSPPNCYAWDFSPKYPKFPNLEISHWSLAQIEECNLALDEGHLSVKRIDSPGLHEGDHMWTETLEPKNRTPRQKRGDESRLLLHKTIVEKLGREIKQRTSSNNHINPTKDDPDAPNGYRWAFSSEYKAFPENKRIKDWSIGEHEACRAAIEGGFLKVQLVSDQDDSKQTSPRQRTPDEPVIPSTTAVQSEMSQVDSNPTSAKQDSSSGPPPVEPLESNSEELTFDEKLYQLLHEPFSRVKNVVGSALKTHLETESSLREELQKQTEQVAQRKSQVEALEQQVRLFQQGKVQDRDKINQAREEGRQEGQDLAMKIMRETDEATKQSELRTHFEQIKRAREEGREEGRKEGIREGLRQAQEKGSDENSENRAWVGTVRPPFPYSVPRKRISNTASGQVSRSGSLDEGQGRVNNTTAEASQGRSAQQQTSPPKPFSFRGFRAINEDSNASNTATSGTKRARPGNSSEANQDAPDLTNGSSATTSAIPPEQRTAENEDIYNASPPRKRRVLDSVSNSKQREIESQWKDSKKWRY